MFETGLVSISFRDMSPETILSAASCAGLQGIEWGGDVHVPCGDCKRACKVGEMTRNSGLKVTAYGSYYRLGEKEQNQPSFDRVLETAQALGAPLVRVWAGAAGTLDTSPEQRAEIITEAIKIADMAAAKKITIALECHHNTLTDRWPSALDLLEKVSRPNLKMYWQPNQYLSFQDNLEAAKHLAADTINLHVFYWDSQRRYPLTEGTAVWKEYLSIFKETEKHYGLLLEFMHDDRLESLQEATKTLQGWL